MTSPESAGAAEAPDLDGTNLVEDKYNLACGTDPRLEEAVVACGFISPAAIDTAIDAGVRIQTFRSPATRRIWAGMLQLRAVGIPIDTVTLPPTVDGQLEGVHAFLARICVEVPTPTRMQHYASLLVRSAYALDAKLALVEAIEAIDAGEDVDDVLAETRDRIREIGGKR